MNSYLHLYFKKYIEKPDPFCLQLMLAIRCFIATSLTSAAVFYYRLPQGMWLVFSTVFVMMMFRGQTYKRRFLTALIGGLSMAFLTFISAAFAQSFLMYFLLMTACVFAIFFLGKWGPDIGLPAALSFFLILMSANKPALLPEAFQRLEWAMLGTLLAFIFTALLWPYRPKKLRKQLITLTFDRLKRLLVHTTNEALCGNYHRLKQYTLKQDTLELLQQSQNLIQHYPDPQALMLINFQVKLFAQIIMLSELLSRPNAEYMLDVITPELKKLSAIADKINRITKTKLRKDFEDILKSLESAIAQNSGRSLIVQDMKAFAYILEQLRDTAQIANEKINETIDEGMEKQ